MGKKHQRERKTQSKCETQWAIISRTMVTGDKVTFNGTLGHIKVNKTPHYLILFDKVIENNYSVFWFLFVFFLISF